MRWCPHFGAVEVKILYFCIGKPADWPTGNTTRMALIEEQRFFRLLFVALCTIGKSAKRVL